MAYKGSLVELPLFGTFWVYEHVYKGLCNNYQEGGLKN